MERKSPQSLQVFRMPDLTKKENSRNLRFCNPMIHGKKNTDISQLILLFWDLADLVGQSYSQKAEPKLQWAKSELSSRASLCVSGWISEMP